MTYLLIAILTISVTMTLVAQFMMWLVRKMTAITLTERFQDAEYILTHSQPPEHWAKPRSPFVRFMQGANIGNFIKRLRYALTAEPSANQAHDHFLTRLDELIDFFEVCPFFQDEGSRDIMLNQLWDERDAWENGSKNESDTPTAIQIEQADSDAKLQRTKPMPPPRL